MDIRNCISELLVLHDCVIIPGFGGFIGNYSPARIDPVHHAFVPPGKKLLFNVNLKQNDGLLANCVAATFGISYVNACSGIDEITAEIRHLLKAGKSFTIPGVGHLTQGREGNLQFEQDKTVNLLPDAFGLTSFISPPVGRATGSAKTVTSVLTPLQNTELRRYSVSRTLKWAAILAIPLGAAAIIGISQFDKITPSGVNNAGILGSVFSRFSSASLVEKKEAPAIPDESTYQQDPAPSVFDTPSTESAANINESGLTTSTSLPDPAENGDYKAATPEQTVQEVPVSSSNTNDRFAVIVGAFKSKENAEKFIRELKQKGTEALIFDRSRGGLYRVTIGTFAIREEADQLLSSTRNSEFSGAWLLAK